MEDEDEDLGNEEMWKMKRKVTKRATTGILQRALAPI